MIAPCFHSRGRLYLVALVVATGLVLALSQQAAASIYVCKDGSGNMHFTNLPESGNCVPFKKKQKRSSLSKWHSTATHKSYDTYIKRSSKRYRIDPNLIKAVIKAESGFNRTAVSSKGAQGLMQLMPETARELNVMDPFHPGQNIEGGTRYLRYLLDTFNNDLTLTLAAYNAGPTLVKRVNRVPRIPETINYVKQVLAYYQSFGNGKPVDALYRSTINVGGLVTVQ